jgi:hypothetical protein
MNKSLWESDRMTAAEAIDLTAQSLSTYGASHDYWSVAYSGGKDSTALLTATVHLIESGLPCGHCGGSGRIELTGICADTLDYLRRIKEPICGAELAKLFDGCTNMAMCNRLVVLEKYGYAKSTRYGRMRLWVAASPELKAKETP